MILKRQILLKAIVTEKPLFQLRSDLVVFREFKVSIEKSVEQSTF